MPVQLLLCIGDLMAQLSFLSCCDLKGKDVVGLFSKTNLENVVQRLSGLFCGNANLEFRLFSYIVQVPGFTKKPFGCHKIV